MQLNCGIVYRNSIALISKFVKYLLTIAMPNSKLPRIEDPIDALLSAHGLRRTATARRVLGWLLAHPDTSYTHAQLQTALQSSDADGADGVALDRVTLYRLIDRLTQVGLLLCRVDAQRLRRYQAMPASVHALPHFECQSCHRDSSLAGALQGNALDLEVAAQSALQALRALGYQGLSLDLAVRGVCADCATAHHTDPSATAQLLQKVKS
jgi:Fur family ferric uptake transcriptional regulator